MESSIELKSMGTITSPYDYKSEGEGESYRGTFYLKGKKVSPWHDIPLWKDEKGGVAHMVVEIPKGETAKMEIQTTNENTPIQQDMKNGKPRFVATKYPFAYGAFPQTWENPAVTHPVTKCGGDNDPVDAIEISGEEFKTGDVIAVKILGTYAMIDDGETDWKILCIYANHPKAEEVNDLADIENAFPGFLKEAHTWLRDYKVPDGKPQNSFGFDDEPQKRSMALEILRETHIEWHQLREGKVEKGKKWIPSTDFKSDKHEKPIIVEVLVHVRDFLSVDPVNLSVTLDFTVQMWWNDPALVGKANPDLDKAWDPNIEIYNGIDMREIEPIKQLKDKATGLVKKKIRYLGTLSNWIDLHHFPFDQENCNILIRPKTLNYPAIDFKLPAQDKWNTKDALGSLTGTGLPDWQVGQPTCQVGLARRHTTDETTPNLILTLPIRRLSSYFLWRTLIVIFSLVVISWSTFYMTPDFADRMQINITLLLTMTAFFSSIGDQLPKVPYLTWMDKVNLFSFALIFAACIQNFAVYMLSKQGEGSSQLLDYPDAPKIVDYVSRIAFPVVYLLFVAFISVRLLWSRPALVSYKFPSQHRVWLGRVLNKQSDHVWKH